MRYDAVIVGAGPAGLAAAIAFAERGCEVCVLERQRGPIDKACGEGWLPTGLRQLERLGLNAHVSHHEGHPIMGVRYITPSGASVEAAFREGSGLGLRRVALSRALMARAAVSPRIELRQGLETTAFMRGRRGMQVTAASGGSVEAPLLVGADGLRSGVRRWAGLEQVKGSHRRWGMRRHFAVQPWTDHVEVHWTAGAEAYATPTGVGEVGVAMLWSPAQIRLRGGGEGAWRALLERFPRLVQRLQGAQCLSDVEAVGPLQQRVKDVAAEGVALVGDAAGYLDAITGEGLNLAVSEALSLARHAASAVQRARAAGRPVQRAELSAYARDVARLMRGHQWMTQALLQLAQHPQVLEHTVRSMSPRALQHLLSVNMGSRDLHSLLRRPLEGLDWAELARVIVVAGARASLVERHASCESPLRGTYGERSHTDRHGKRGVEQRKRVEP